jgi:hypothetical protein
VSDNPSSDRPADREPRRPGFAEGEAMPEAYPEDDRVGRFSEGQDELGEEDPEKHIKGTFSTGEDDAS